MITFAVKLPTVAPGWRNLSGTLSVKIPERLLSGARRFCFGAAEALEADRPVSLELAEDPPCASGKIHHVLRGTWTAAGGGPVLSAVVGAAPERLETLLESFNRDQLMLQLLLVGCPEEDGAEPEICFEILVRS